MKTVVKENIGTKISNIKGPSGTGERYSSYARLEQDLQKLGVPVGNRGYTGISPAQSEFCYR